MPAILIDDGVRMQNVAFCGSQAWVRGGLRWHDTRAEGVSFGITLENVRTEQPIDSSAFSIDIRRKGRQTIQHLRIRDCYLSLYAPGIYLERVTCAEVEHNQHHGKRPHLVEVECRETGGHRNSWRTWAP